jgi:RHS repeat-associated protein
VDDAGQAVSYTYTSGGRLLTRTWARSGGSIVTTYGYDPNTAELLSVNYSDTTPDLTFTYDRLGRQTAVTDGLGSRTFSYNTSLQPLSESISGLYSKVLTRTYETTGVIGRSTGLNTGADYSLTYGYDPTGRFNSLNWNITGMSGTATYAYVPNSDLLASLTTGSGQATAYTYEPNRNLRTQVRNNFNAGTVSQYDYAYDALGRRTSAANTGSAFSAAAFNRFNYNTRSELNESARYLGTDINNFTSPVTGEYRGFTYDPIGNRTTITEGVNPGTYTTNNLNQYSTATLPVGGTNTFTHDLDGNLTAISGAKNVTYTYNAENRLITAAPTTPAVNDKKLDMVYDYQGRRVQKITSNWNGSTWATETTKRFVYDGWNMIEEQTVSGTSKYYVWGHDLSQSLQGAGGIGGLIARVESATSHNFLYDGNGNVGQLVDVSDGSIDAQYEYDPYGNSIVATGVLASTNPYRFSTKYLDAEFNLYYYGQRYYDPATGRWLSRDPIGEIDSHNLYIFVGNDSINRIDFIGLTKIGTILDFFFSVWDIGEQLWIMDENDSYTRIVRDWDPVQGNIRRLKRAVASNPSDWDQNHRTSLGWRPTMSYSPDPNNGWDKLERNPAGTDPETARRNFIIFLNG